MLVLPVPAVPDTRMLLPLKNPFPSSILSSDGTPEDTRSDDTPCCNFKDVIGNTEIPSSSIRNGYSFVPCTEPRYFMILKSLVEIWLLTRWSNKITQSDTYSSSPCLVRKPSPFSPVIIAV